MATRQELQDGISALAAKNDEILAKDEALIAAVTALIAKLPATGSEDFSAELAAVSDILTKESAEGDKIQAAADAATTATPK